MIEKLLRRARGILGTGLTWAVGWATVMGLPNVPIRLLTDGFRHLSNDLGTDIMFAAIFGGCGGIVFASGFALSEGQRRLSEVRTKAGTLWGVAAGFFGPAVFAITIGELGDYLAFVVETPLFFVTMATLSAVSGAGMTAIAKSAERGELGPGAPSSTAVPEGP